MSLIRKHRAVLQAWACLALVIPSVYLFGCLVYEPNLSNACSSINNDNHVTLHARTIVVIRHLLFILSDQQLTVKQFSFSTTRSGACAVFMRRLSRGCCEV